MIRDVIQIGSNFPGYPDIGTIGGGFGSPLSIGIPSFDLGQINVSLGRSIDRRDNALTTMSGALKVHLETTARLKELAAKTNLRIRTVQDKGVLPVSVAAPPLLRPPVSIRPVTSGGDTGRISPPPTTGNRPMGLDLGNVLTTLGGSYINARYGGVQTVNAPVYSQPSPSVLNALGTQTGLMNADIGIPFVDVIPEAATKGMVWNPAANCGQGKWQKKSKRRRRRLATASDIKDLAALNGVTTGQQKVTWIATHPS